MEIDPSPAQANDELEFIELTGINDDALDQELAERIRGLRKTLDVVLMFLAQQLPTQPDLQFTTRISKLSDAAYERLLDMLHEAIQSGKYHKLRRLKLLQKSPPERDQPNAPVVQEIPTYVEKAWGTEYRGQYPRLLLDNIRNMSNQPVQPYAKQVAIIQSSGTGKSRMVHELSKLIFTIPFNLRLGEESREFAFPKPDNAIRDYLNGENMTEKEYGRFFHAVFRTIGSVLEEKYAEIDKVCIGASEINPRQRFATWWADYLSTPGTREGIYKRILDEINGAILPRAKEAFEISEVAKPEIVRAFEQIGKGIREKIFGRENNLSMVIYFDEVQTLFSHSSSTDNAEEKRKKNRYDALCSAASYFTNFDIFFIFLSTNSSLPKLAPTRQNAVSARISRGEADLNTPIIEIPFDCHHKTVGNGELLLNETISVHFLARFGRPLFWTLLESQDAVEPERIKPVESDVLALAKRKLILTGSPSRAQLIGKLAAVDVMINLNYEPNRIANRNIQEAMVAHHARIVYAIPSHREYMRTGYSSEPLLAEAAHQLVYEWENKEPSFLIDTLITNNDNGVLSKGHTGEMVARLILSSAYRRAVVQDSGGKSPNFSAGCCLVTFIKQLFSDQHANIVLESIPDNVSDGEKFEDAFRDATLRFTHFITMSSRSNDGDHCPWTSIAWAAFVRGAAIIGQSTQDTTDFMIPVLNGKDSKIGESTITAILIQIKNKIRAGQRNKYLIDAKAVGFFPKNTEIFRPYVCLVMELGVALPTQKTKDPTEPKEPKKGKGRQSAKTSAPTQKRPRTVAETPSKIGIYQGGLAWKKPSKYQEHARYHIFAYGCSSTIYKNVEKAKFAKLLGVYDVFDDHARQDDESLAAIRNMKPTWEPGSHCFRWTAGDVNLRDELKFERQAEEKLVIFRGDDNDLAEGFGDDGVPKLQPPMLEETMESGGSDEDDGNDSEMDLDQEGSDIHFQVTGQKRSRHDSAK